MAILKILALCMILNSCAKLNYVYEQSVGQISLLTRAKDNKDVAVNVRLPKEHREKIKRIESLKKYFYKYWEKKETLIYSKTTLLKTNAVTYLVIASPFEEIKAVENCFPVMGCFPYLGFFNLESAQDFAKEKESEGYVTWLRPVYAYSTLGYFTDTILSSFFHYNDVELTELIFHELFHTIFFVTNEVELNENLANYFSKEMMSDYFKEMGMTEELKIQSENEIKEKALNSLIVKLALDLKELYKNLVPKNKDEAKVILDEFMESTFKKEVAHKCMDLKIPEKECFALNKKWNNARFAAFLTYENKSDDLEKLQKRLGLNLKDYFYFIAKKYQDYENLEKSRQDGFSKFLFKE